MTDVDTGAEAPAEPKAFIASVPLKFGLEIEVNFDELDIEMYKMLLIEGAKAVLTTVGMSKKGTGISKLEGAAKEKALKEFYEQAEANLKGLKEGTLSKGRAKASKVSGAVATEALRLAKLMVKQHIKDNGQKVGAYSAKEITEAAKKVLEGNPALIKKAEENLAARAGDVKSVKGMDLTALFGEKANSEEVKAKPKAPPKRKAKEGEEKAPLSAKQASMVAPRKKPEAHTTH